jgi:uncharacterized repeat protein (TIGR03803 family)
MKLDFFRPRNRKVLSLAFFLSLFWLATAVSSPAQTFTTLANFNGTNGVSPAAALVQGTDGNFYGTTSRGGAGNGGTVFKITSGGTLTTLHSFAGATDGAFPVAALVQGTDGNFYGTTSRGGAGNSGTVFKITSGGNLTTLYSFCSQGGNLCTDGISPVAALVQGTDGNFYGTTSSGGAGNGGTVFKITSGGTLTTLHSFAGATDGVSPVAALVQGTDGNFYGTTSGGGAGNGGTVFSLSVGLAPFVETIPSSGQVGAAVIILGTNLTGATGVSFNGTAATFTVVSSSEIQTTVPAGATTGIVQVTTPSGTLNSNVAFQVRFVTSGDFDGDGKADVAVWRPSTGTWYIIPSSKPTTFTTRQWGLPGDIPVPGDYDGDGITDIAVFRPSNGTWYIIPSSKPNSPIIKQWGLPGDIPVPGDYDRDGKTDFAVWRPSNGTWYIIQSSTGIPIQKQWGLKGDIPVPRDYDGDGKTDFAVWRPSNGTWYITRSSTGTSIQKQWGLPTDLPVPGDYDGDGKTDFAVWRPSTGTWYVIPSSKPTTFTSRQWGKQGDIPVPRDYDRDAKTDIAVWRPSNGVWYIIPSSNPTTFTTRQWGLSTDVPVQKPVGQ